MNEVDSLDGLFPRRSDKLGILFIEPLNLIGLNASPRRFLSHTTRIMGIEHPDQTQEILTFVIIEGEIVVTTWLNTLWTMLSETVWILLVEIDYLLPIHIRLGVVIAQYERILLLQDGHRVGVLNPTLFNKSALHHSRDFHLLHSSRESLLRTYLLIGPQGLASAPS